MQVSKIEIVDGNDHYINSILKERNITPETLINIETIVKDRVLNPGVVVKNKQSTTVRIWYWEEDELK